MNQYFKRQLADYVEYHRDPINCAMHVFGIVTLFLAAVLPLSLWTFDVFGVQTNAGVLLALPVLIYWLALDVGLGIGILCAAILLLSTAASIIDYVSIVGVWSISAVLIVVGVSFQVIGHRVFEERQPALVDNPTHLLLGPMFVMAKLYVALGFRNDLAVILQIDPRTQAKISSQP